ncbi:MAG TPA: ImmA/IrrE family metallo-endopeptidase [Rhizomicrobium sp.]
MRLEPDSDLAHPLAHLAIDAFCRIVELLYPKPIHVVRTEFSPEAKYPFPRLKSPEFCIKNPAAILAIGVVERIENLTAEVSASADWLPPMGQINAARQSASFLLSMSDSNFVDLICKVLEGGNDVFLGRSRFSAGKRIQLVAKSPSTLVEKVSYFLPVSSDRALMTSAIVYTDSLPSVPAPNKSQYFRNLVHGSDGLIVVAENEDVNIATVLRYGREHDLPMLVLTGKQIPLPCEVLSQRNVAVFDVRRCSDDRLLSILRGFVSDKWKVGTLEPAMRLMLAARGCKRETHESKINHMRDIRAIANKLPPERSLWQGFFQFDRDRRNFIGDLPDDVELAAQEVRKRLAVETYSISRGKLLRAFGPAKELSLKITASGYLVSSGCPLPYTVIALREGDGPQRQKFTLGHELAHLILAARKTELSGDEEEYCDRFSAAILMPGDMIAKFGNEAVGLLSWIDFPKTFDVSFSAARNRLWYHQRILLVSSLDSWGNSPQLSVTNRILEIGEELKNDKQRRGEIDDVPYVVLRSNGFVSGVADFRETVGRIPGEEASVSP